MHARCFIGRVLPRTPLARDDVPSALITFAKPFASKPSEVTPDFVPFIACNISHSNELVAIAFARGARDSAGVDALRLSPPLHDSFETFDGVEKIVHHYPPPEDEHMSNRQLTTNETATLLALGLSSPNALRLSTRSGR
ncbi:hypothetical protein K488DRAFT_90766 [Vararia minispora EC-137]|uniref:Uncharacterized protein n=1 Tax=Vararia minispora EC-137 TaxID=1314806 RepID=A0ACB8Q773_9AGAM|nr:hypothetical protein K488DRAFT_90766 [Vararia minispora EC-137]